MKKFFISSILFLLFSSYSYYLYFTFIKKKELIGNLDFNLDKIPTEVHSDSIFFDAGIYNLKGKLYSDSIFFTPKILNNISKAISQKIKTNPYFNIKIIGFYSSRENSIKGTQRASFFIKHLKISNILKGDIIINTQENNFISLKKNKISMPIAIKIIKLSPKEIFQKKKENLYTVFQWTSRNQNFSFSDSKNLKKYAKKLKYFIDSYPNEKITVKVIGHTDNIGSIIDNNWIGMQRAKSVRNFLLYEGISISFFKIESKGESVPIKSNVTKEGRNKNKRVEIIIE